MIVHKNIHLDEVSADFTLEFDVKLNISNGNFNNKGANISETDRKFEEERGYFQKSYGNRCFKDIKKAMRCNWIKDFAFTGRSGGWFTLLCEDKDMNKVNKITDEQFKKLSKIVEMYLNNYYRELELYYNL